MDVNTANQSTTDEQMMDILLVLDCFRALCKKN